MTVNREQWGAVWPARGVLAVLALLAVAAAGGAQDTPAAKSKVMFEKTCSACHTSESVSGARRTRDQWQEVIEEMVTQQGAKIADEEFDPILQYLISTYGKVNVNSAPADEISQIVGLSQQEAETIVKFRKEKGKFADFEALCKVPGIDSKKLEKSREAISF